MTLPSRDRLRLVKTLALLSSPVDGQRLAAVDAAGRILASNGMTWAELLKPREVMREPQFGIWRQTCAELQKRSGSLRPWERSFVESMPKFTRISSKQRHILNEIAKRVLGGDAP